MCPVVSWPLWDVKILYWASWASFWGALSTPPGCPGITAHNRADSACHLCACMDLRVSKDLCGSEFKVPWVQPSCLLAVTFSVLVCSTRQYMFHHVPFVLSASGSFCFCQHRFTNTGDLVLTWRISWIFYWVNTLVTTLIELPDFLVCYMTRQRWNTFYKIQ